MLRQRGDVRPAGDLDDLERPDDPPAVAGQDLLGGLRIPPGQLLVQRPRSVRRQLRFEAGADDRVGAREDEVVEDRADVQGRTPGQDRDLLPVDAVVDRGAGQLLELGDGRGLGDVEHVEQVVRYAAALRRTDLRRTDVHAAVHLHCIRVHDLAAQALGQGNSEVGLPGRGRADDRDDEWSRHRSSLAGLRPPPRHRPGSWLPTARGPVRCEDFAKR